MAIGEYPFSPLSSFRANARNLFRSRSGKMRGQRKTGSTVFLKTCNHGVSRKLIHAGNRKRKRSLGSARDDDTRVRFPHVSFHPTAKANLRPFGAPPSNGRRENANLRPFEPPPSNGRRENANLRPFGAPPSSGRRERCESPPSLKEGTKKRSPCGLRSLISKTIH